MTTCRQVSSCDLRIVETSPFGGEYQHPDIGVGAEASNDVSQIEPARDGERVHRRVVHHYLGDSLRNRV